MKRVIICVMLFLTYFSACGQNSETGMPRKAEEKDIKEMASARTSQVTKELGLTQKQAKKIYKLIYEELSEMMPEANTEKPSGSMQGGPGGGRPGMRPQGGRPGNPGMTGQDRPGMNQPRSREGLEGLSDSQRFERQENREKKYAKILTEEQFRRWKHMENERLSREFNAFSPL